MAKTLYIQLGIVTLAKLAAVYFEQSVYPQVTPQPIRHVAIAVISLLLAYGLARLPAWKHTYHTGRYFRVMAAAVLLATGIAKLVVPQMTWVHAAYFAFQCLYATLFMIIIPARAGGFELQKLRTLAHTRPLLQLWLRYRLQVRYSQTLLGILWIVLLPLAEAIVFTFVFQGVFGIQSPGAPFVSFFLSGSALFSIFQGAVSKGRSVLLKHMGLMQQVYFPREIVVLLELGETLIDFFFMFVTMVIINAFFGIYPTVYFVFLPVPILLILVLATGVGLIVSWGGLFVQDLQQLIGVLMKLLYYMTVLYTPERVPSPFRYVAYLNPLSSIVEMFRDIIIYAQPPDWSLLYAPLLLTVSCLYMGYTLFKANEGRFVDFS